VKGRGNYFDGTDFWEVDNDIAVLHLHHQLSLFSWIRVETITAAMTIFSKNRQGAAGADEERSVFLGITSSKTLGLKLDDGTTTKVDKSSTTEVPEGSWAFAGFVVKWSQSQLQSNIEFYINQDVDKEVVKGANAHVYEHSSSLASIGQVWVFDPLGL
jgi:hypothetical protein